MKAYLLDYRQGALTVLGVVHNYNARTPGQVRDSPREHRCSIQVKELLG
jgi:hypothetical protein